jgi:hypothetical protein
MKLTKKELETLDKVLEDFLRRKKISSKLRQDAAALFEKLFFSRDNKGVFYNVSQD